MNVQQSPRKATAEIEQYLHEVDRASGSEARHDLTPPGYGGPQRDAINSVVDGIVGDICAKTAELRKMLDSIDQTVLQSAAKSKYALTEHVATCVRINDEIVHMREVIADLAEQAREP